MHTFTVPTHKPAQHLLKTALAHVWIRFPAETNAFFYYHELRIVCPNQEIAVLMIRDEVVRSILIIARRIYGHDFVDQFSIRIDIRGENRSIYDISPGFLKLY